MTLPEELRDAYHAFHKSQAGHKARGRPRGSAMSAVEVLWVEIYSTGHGYLLVEDQDIRENLSFAFPLLSPGSGPPASECLILGHGFNESEYAKLFPWAYCLCRELKIPVMVFPCAFHINRRPGSWIRMARSCHHRRKRVPGNRSSSPFNAVVSQRISEAPERFLRGALQSYRDLTDLLKQIQEGTLTAWGPRGPVRPLARGATPHFLGYSISGYLFLGALLMDGEPRLQESLLVLFNSFASWDEANPVSVLVIDQEAYERGTLFYLEDYREKASKEFRFLYEETREGRLFRRLFLKSNEELPLSREVSRLKERLLLICDPHDPIFPARAIQNHLGDDILTVLMALGRHEFPFNLPRCEMGFQQLARAMRESWAPAAGYREALSHWISLLVRFLRPSKRVPGWKEAVSWTT